MVLDRIIAVFLAIVVLFWGALILVSQKQDQTIETYAGNAVDEFVNKACATGFISGSSYEEMVQRLDSTGVVYSIYLVHSKEVIEPTVELENGENRAQVGSYEKYFKEYRNQDILGVIYPDPPTSETNNYYMEEGDFFKVVIENKTPTLAKRWRSMFSSNPSNTPSILVSRSGYVGNEIK